jgi:hypothetical protein
MKRKRIIDQVYNGAFENANLSNSSKRALFGAAGILIAGILISLKISKNGRL